MDLSKRCRNFTKYFLISILSLSLVISYSATSNLLLIKTFAQVNDPLQISNDQVKDNYLLYIQEVAKKGSNSECQQGLGVGVLQGDDIICNPGLENLEDKAKLDDQVVGKLSENIDKDKQVTCGQIGKTKGEDGKGYF